MTASDNQRDDFGYGDEDNWEDPTVIDHAALVSFYSEAQRLSISGVEIAESCRSRRLAFRICRENRNLAELMLSAPGSGTTSVKALQGENGKRPGAFDLL
jgi:hypothetical protein